METGAVCFKVAGAVCWTATGTACWAGIGAGLWKEAGGAGPGIDTGLETALTKEKGAGARAGAAGLAGESRTGVGTRPPDRGALSEEDPVFSGGPCGT